MSTDHVIETSHLCVGYNRTDVLPDISFSASRGELVALMGTNGSGKSTLLRTIAGLLEPVRGDVSVLGGAPGSQPERVAYLPQHPKSIASLPLRARDVVGMGRYPRLGLTSRFADHDNAVVDRAMERMSVTAFANKPLHGLSGGQQQRVHLAQMLAREADLLLLDEPTAGLDAQGRAAVNVVIEEERARGCTVVVATHDLGDAEPADTVFLLSHGIVAQGIPSQVLTNENLRRTYGFTERH